MQSAETLSLVAQARQQDLLREAKKHRLVNLAQESHRQTRQMPKFSITNFVQRLFAKKAQPQQVPSNATC
jgi:hypothetical protein